MSGIVSMNEDVPVKRPGILEARQTSQDLFQETDVEGDTIAIATALSKR
jgi:hypothetical protein